MKKSACLLILFFTLFISAGYAQKGKDGAKTISTAANVVNEYTSLTKDAASGATSITVATSGLNTNNRFSTPLGNGDLVMIIQMQGATIDGTPNDSSWGAITSYNNCGLYEFLEVTGVPNAITINISCSLKNGYTASGKVEVIRVPRYSSLIINSGGSITADPWNGTQGGIIAIEVQGNTTISAGGSIKASGEGFRGGKLNINSGGPNITHNFFSTDINQGGEKGESIAGYESDYSPFGGAYMRGAPANGGGGGNAWNSPGGGGANAGDITKWTGNGNPDVSNANFITAWKLENTNFPNTTSSGGGRGGYSVGFSGNSPLTTGPDNPAWPTYSRSNTGGKGGRPLDYSTGRIFFGGGGGAAHVDDGFGTGGANGGGIVYILSYGAINGSGNILSNGDTAANANCGNHNGDPPGGAGGGGTVILNSTGSITGISISADGGKGGDQLITQTGESEGPGGGGGGGYIAFSNGTPATQANGGVNGITNSVIMTSFPPDGATRGGNGMANETIAPLVFSSLIIDAGNDITICNGQSAQLNVTGGDDSDIYSWSPPAGLDSTNITDPIAKPGSTTQYVVTVSNGTCTGKDSMVVTVISKVVIKPVEDTSICEAASVGLDPGGSSAYNYTWSPPAGLNCTNCNNPVATPSATTTYTVIATNQYCSDTGLRIITVLPLPTLSINDTTICHGQITYLNAVTNGTLTWSPATYLSCTTCKNPQVTPFSNTTYTITATLGNCITTENFNLSVDQPVVFAGIDTTIFNGQSAILRGSGARQYQWLPSNSLSSSIIQNPLASPSTSTTYTLIGYDSFGCSAEASVVVFVNNPCDIPALPNAFSPNGDGKNDVYKMINPFVDKLIIFGIYNRWGQLVFQTTDLTAGWDGNFNGKPEPVGTYAYYLKVICQGANLIYKGNVTLLR